MEGRVTMPPHGPDGWDANCREGQASVSQYLQGASRSWASFESGVRGISLRSTQRENLLLSPTHRRCSWLSPRLTLPADSPLPLGSIVISWSSDLHLHLPLHCATSQHRRTFDHSIDIVHPSIHALHILLLTSTSTSISDAGQTEPWPPTVGITNFSTRRTHPSIARCQYHTVFCSP